MTETSICDLRVNDIKLLAAMQMGCVLTCSRGIGKWSRGCIVQISHPDGRYRELPDTHLWRILHDKMNKMISVVSSELPREINRRIETYGLTPDALRYLEHRCYRLDLDKYLEVKMTPDTLQGMEFLRDGCRILVTHAGGHHVIDERENYKIYIWHRQFETFVQRFLEPAGEHSFNKCKIFSFTDAGREWLAANVKPKAAKPAAATQETT